jgi:hypothetical protein
MIPSSEKGLARSETRNHVIINQTALVAAGLESVKRVVDYPHEPISRQPVATKAVFFRLRFHKTARKRQQVPNPCSDVCLNLKQANQTKSGSDCAHCQPACEAATGRPDPLNGLSADLSEGMFSTSLLTASGRKAVNGWIPFTGKKGKPCLMKSEGV